MSYNFYLLKSLLILFGTGIKGLALIKSAKSISYIGELKMLYKN